MLGHWGSQAASRCCIHDRFYCFFFDFYEQNAVVHVYGTCDDYVDAVDLFVEMIVRDVVW